MINSMNWISRLFFAHSLSQWVTQWVLLSLTVTLSLTVSHSPRRMDGESDCSNMIEIDGQWCGVWPLWSLTVLYQLVFLYQLAIFNWKNYASPETRQRISQKSVCAAAKAPLLSNLIAIYSFRPYSIPICCSCEESQHPRLKINELDNPATIICYK